MADEPEVTNGTRQPSRRFAVDFHLNDAFVTAVGSAKAQEFLDILHEVANTHGHEERTVIEAELRRRMDRIGIQVSDVEMDSFADQINRSDGTVQAVHHNPYDPEEVQTREE